MLKRIYKETDLLIFTSNGVVKNNGELVMGKGIARFVRDEYPGIAQIFGRLVKEKGNIPFIVEVNVKNKPRYIMNFPTKHHWKDPSDIKLIKKSRTIAERLIKEYLEEKPDSFSRVLCPIWGTENGGLTMNEVKEELLRFRQNLPIPVVFFNRNGIVDLKIKEYPEIHRCL